MLIELLRGPQTGFLSWLHRVTVTEVDMHPVISVGGSLACAAALVWLGQWRRYCAGGRPSGPSNAASQALKATGTPDTTGTPDITGVPKNAGPPEVAATTPKTDGTPMVHVLGPVRIDGVQWDLTPQQLAFVTYLACVGEAGRDAIIDALWDGRAVSKSRLPNLLAELRAKIGRHHLPDAAGGRYRLVGIVTDLSLLEAAVAHTRDGVVDGAAAERLHEAMAMADGVPFTVPASRHWSWLSARTDLVNRAEVLVVTAASLLGAHHRGEGRLDRARQACERGLATSPLDEDLTRMLIDVLIQLGKPTQAERVAESWRARVADLGTGVGADLGSADPYRGLTGATDQRW